MAQASDAPGAKYDKEKDRLTRAVERGDLTERDRELIQEYLDAVDPDEFNTQPPGEMKAVTKSSLRSYAKNLRLVATAADTPLCEIEVRALNDLMEEMQQELSDNTVQQRQSALRNFYRYHSDLGIDPGMVYMVQNEESRVDPRDLLRREDADAMRAEFDEDRDRALFDLMLYTGQRIRAVQTLRLKDIDASSGRFHLNTDAAGLKGAKGMRPLLLAKASMMDWLENHPEWDTNEMKPRDTDAYVFTSLPSAAKRDPHTPVHQTTISRPIKAAAKAAGIDRPEERGHPHNLRHSFVRWAYVERDMDVQTIKYMGGWAADSNTFEETYFNILDQEFAKKAENYAGVRDESEDEGDDLVPESCPFCDNVLSAGAKACEKCGNVLSPDAAAAQNQIEEATAEGKDDAESLDEYKFLDQLERAAREDPEGLADALSNISAFDTE